MRSYVQIAMAFIVLNSAVGTDVCAQPVSEMVPQPGAAAGFEAKEPVSGVVWEESEVYYPEQRPSGLVWSSRYGAPAEAGIAHSPFSKAGQYTSGWNILVIPATETNKEELVPLTEDMHVMLRIIDKRFGRLPWFDEELGEEGLVAFRDYFGQDGRATEAIYMEGYGVLFLMELDFPLLPPPEAEKDKPDEVEKAEEHIDSIWRQTYKEIFTPEELEKEKDRRLRKGYDAKRVDDLKESLVKLLKHAANIRNVKPEEWIILTAKGKTKSLSGTSSRYRSSDGRSYSRTTTRRRLPSGDIAAASQRTVLTIRVKKSNVDAFAKGEVDLDQFRGQVQIFAY